MNKRNGQVWVLCLLLITGLFLSLASLLSGCKAEGRNTPDSESEKVTTTEAHHLSVEEAKEIAFTFWENNDELRSGLSELNALEVSLAFAEPDENRQLRSATSDANTDSHSSLPAYYVFNMGNGSERGYVIVSAWDVTFPILAYSAEGHFFGSDIANECERPAEATNILSFLNAYATSIDSLRQVTKVTSKLKATYNTALRGVVVDQSLRAYNSISPRLGNIKWNQSPYYNEYIPYGHPVGCVATATTQIMRYWKYPPRGTGSHTSNVDGKYANFNKAYNWEQMPAATLRSRNHEIAQLSYDVAVGLNMQFSPYGSGTWQYYVPALLVNHFYYKNTARDIYRSGYNTEQWTNIVYNELANGRPVQYAGSGNGGGHSFVCDGYHSNGYFHINWGWGGMSDGYFLLHALDPNSLGTGGGSGGFNYGQDIVIGIEPNQQPNPDPTLGTGDVTSVNLNQFKQMLTFRGGNRVEVGSNYSTPMVVFVKATGCNYCNHTEPSIELLAEEYKGKVKFYSFDVNPYGNWEHWDFITNLLGIETVPQVLFISDNGTYVLKNGVVTTTTVADGAKVFRPYIEALLEGGDQPTPSDDYCQSTGRYARSTYIAQVKVANVNNVTQSNTGGYNFFEQKKVELTAGETYSITLKPGSLYGNYPEYFKVWIDLNGDNVFSDNELVANFVTNQSNVAVTKNFTILENAKVGNTRMRVSMKWGSSPEACEIFDHGEVEDYPVEIKTKYIPEPEPEEDPYPVSYGRDSRYAYISSVSIGNMRNNSRGDNYTSYINTHHVVSSSGRALTYNLSPSFGTSQAYWCYWRIWIDYNRDGIFSDSELVVSRYGYQTISGWFSLPTRIGTGLYRVRVSMKMNDGYPRADEIFDYGEVEDYRLSIK